MKFYLASGFSNRQVLRDLAQRLRTKGHTVVSSWIWVEDRPDKEDELWSSFAVQICHTNMIELYMADALIIDARGIEEEGAYAGTHSELGFMLARGKPVIVIGEMSYNTFSYAGDVIKTSDEAGLFRALLSIQIPPRQPLII